MAETVAGRGVEGESDGAGSGSEGAYSLASREIGWFGREEVVEPETLFIDARLIRVPFIVVIALSEIWRRLCCGESTLSG